MYITVYDKDIAMHEGAKYEIFLEMQQHNGTTFDQDYISVCMCADLAPIKFKWQNIAVHHNNNNNNNNNNKQM
jgi:hypothetical protein